MKDVLLLLLCNTGEQMESYQVIRWGGGLYAMLVILTTSFRNQTIDRKYKQKTSQ